MKKLIEKRLKKLENPLNQEWIFNFHSLIDTFHEHPLILKFIKKFQKKKQKDYDPLLKVFNQLFIQVKASLQHLLKIEKSFPDIYNEIKQDISNISSYKISSVNITDPFFNVTMLYSDYCSLLRKLIEKLMKHEKPELIFPIATIYSHGRLKALEIEYGFSEILDQCQSEMNTFKGKRDIAIWWKWDLVLQCLDWTENGISNQHFEENLKNIFSSYKFGNAVQDIGLYFLEELEKNTENSKNISIKALELFLDKGNKYWIIVHHCGEKDSIEPYYIKRITSPQLLDFLKSLLDLEDYSEIEWKTKTSHHLGELMIKGEFLKVFVPISKKFAGSYVELASLDIPVNIQLIIDELTKKQFEKKKNPSFDYCQYYRSKEFYNS